jgi:hypothetical protein
MKLCGEERIEDLVCVLRGQPAAGIANGHQHLLNGQASIAS